MHMTKDCWKDFAASGRVSDYLRYRKQEQDSGETGETEEEPLRFTGTWTGQAHGADNFTDRHSDIGNACGRI